MIGRQPDAGWPVSAKAIAFAFVSLFVSVFFAERAHAFAENIRHGYVNCTSCHVSPTGGGAVTPYGRELSRELMSTWSYEGEQKWFYASSQPDSLGLGGDVRTAYSYRDDTKTRAGKWYFMQADVEAYANLLGLGGAGDGGGGGKQTLWVGGTLGVEKKNQDQDQYDFISRRHFINYRPTDELSFRAGRFAPQVGLNVPDHVAYFRQDTGRLPGMETYNLEAAWIGDKWTSFATAIFGRPDDLTVTSAEKGYALSTGYAFFEKNRVGVSYYRGENDSQTRALAGPYAMLSFTERLFWLSEIDMQWLSSKSSQAESRGFVTYNRLGYEAMKGVIPYVVHEYKNLADQNWLGRSDAIGLGVQWLPRPHLEANLAWEKRRSPALAEGYVDYAYMMLHFYP